MTRCGESTPVNRTSEAISDHPLSQPGELTDAGRGTTLALGQRLRHLYVDQLKFMPARISDSDMIYLRATPIPRALESVQQAFWGLYPPTARTAAFPAPTIITRTPADETLYPNDGNCRRFAQLSRAFAQRAADRWNDGDDMAYLTQLLGKWMPSSSPKVAVDSRPRLSGIMDTINSTRAHGAATKLPAEFYDAKARTIIDKIACEEWFAGYGESAEYRALGIGALAGDVVERMTGSVQRSGRDGVVEVGGEDGRLGAGRGGEREIKLALSGCHDTTLAAFLASLGAFDGETWPPYTSHIAVELFRKAGMSAPPARVAKPDADKSGAGKAGVKGQGWWASLFGTTNTPVDEGPVPEPEGIARKPTEMLSERQKRELDGYYVRLRYNDRVMKVPGCRQDGRHLEGDESFCTLVSAWWFVCAGKGCRVCTSGKWMADNSARRRRSNPSWTSSRRSAGRRLVRRIWTSRRSRTSRILLDTSE